MTFGCQQVSVSSMKALWPFHTKACSPLRTEWKGWRNCKGKKTISFKIMNPVSMVAARRHLILNNTILQRHSANHSAFPFQKEEKLLSFHSQYFPLLKVTFISQRVFFKSLPLMWVCQRVMSHQHMFRTLAGNVLGNHSKSSDKNWWIFT